MATAKKVSKQAKPVTTPAAKLNKQAKPVAVVPKQAPAKPKATAPAVQHAGTGTPSVTLVQAQQQNSSVYYANTMASTNPAHGGIALAKPTAGANKQRRRVYGYGNGIGGGVPKQAHITVLVQGTPASVDGTSWQALVAYLHANPSATVQQVYAAGLPGNISRVVRRAWRKGHLGFSATPTAQAPAKPAAKKRAAK